MYFGRCEGIGRDSSLTRGLISSILDSENKYMHASRNVFFASLLAIVVTLKGK